MWTTGQNGSLAEILKGYFQQILFSHILVFSSMRAKFCFLHHITILCRVCIIFKKYYLENSEILLFTFYAGTWLLRSLHPLDIIHFPAFVEVGSGLFLFHSHNIIQLPYLLITLSAPPQAELPPTLMGGLISRYAAIVAAMSWGPTNLLIVWAATPLPAKKIGT